MLALLFTPSQLEALRSLGDLHLHLDPERLAAELAGVDLDVMITSWATPPLATWAPGRRPRLIAHTGGTLRPILGDGGVPEGCAVSQASAAMADGVAELALAMCLVLLRELHTFDRALRDPDGGPAIGGLHGRELAHRRIGVIGASRTGRSFISMVRGLGAARVRVADPYLGAEDAAALGVGSADLRDLLAWSEVLVLHAPVTAETIGMLGAAELALLPDGAVVVNTARAALVEEAALVAEALSGRLRFGLDVLHREPLPEDSPLRGLPNVYLSPHRGAATVEARERQGQITVDEIARFVAGDRLQHAIDPAVYARLS
ncbi:hydroxyacid dehydrogenase [Occultella glacieicola]|uniref:Hydroxyacid dehydrogenase n=1 Tax=Occultella glacieicola TaxID=2518684 RepID=A0ABY2E4T4_9MICO|nr:hydroxyacid dehydrogenase [Occultella glacieicola]